MWSDIYKILSTAEIYSDHVVIKNARDFSYTTEVDAIKNYRNLSILLDSLQSVSYIVVPFKSKIPPGGAHVFLSFEIENQEPISISFEARRKVGQSYNPFIGLCPIDQLVGIVGTTRDLVSLRKDCRKDILYSYKLTLNQRQIQELFINLLEQVNFLNSHTIFYNSLTKTCLTYIIKSLNKVIDDKQKIGKSWRTIFPGFSPMLLKNKKLIASH